MNPSDRHPPEGPTLNLLPDDRRDPDDRPDPPGPDGPVRPDVTVVLPCLDEAAALPGVLAAVPAGWAVVVVDNGSRDGSPELAARLGARVVHEPRRGYGAPVHTGIEAARTAVVAVLDCDGSLDPRELVGPVATVLSGEADLVVGRRRVVESRSWPWHARAGNAVLAGLIRASTGVAVHDIAPVRVARREDLLGLGIVDRRFGYPLETVLAAAQAGWRVVEVDVTYRRRSAGGRSKVSGSVRGTLRVLADFTAVLRRCRSASTSGPGPGRPGVSGSSVHPDGSEPLDVTARPDPAADPATGPAPDPAPRPGAGPGTALAPAPATYVVLAKAPVPGQVKTRLTPAYSPHEAAALASAALLDSLDAVRVAGGRRAGGVAPRLVCALTGDLDAAAAPAALEAGLDGFAVVGQRGDGLAERIAHAHTDAALGGGATVQIGMDTPHVDPDVLAGVAARVEDPDGPDAVLGPADDGGWWLLALRRADDARLLADVPMSTNRTGALTRAALEAGGLRVEDAPPLSDVDEPADVVAVASLCPRGRFGALAGVLGGRTGGGEDGA